MSSPARGQVLLSQPGWGLVPRMFLEARHPCRERQSCLRYSPRSRMSLRHMDCDQHPHLAPARSVAASRGTAIRLPDPSESGARCDRLNVPSLRVRHPQGNRRRRPAMGQMLSPVTPGMLSRRPPFAAPHRATTGLYIPPRQHRPTARQPTWPQPRLLLSPGTPKPPFMSSAVAGHRHLSPLRTAMTWKTRCSPPALTQSLLQLVILSSLPHHALLPQSGQSRPIKAPLPRLILRPHRRTWMKCYTQRRLIQSTAGHLVALPPMVKACFVPSLVVTCQPSSAGRPHPTFGRRGACGAPTCLLRRTWPL